MLCIGRVSLIMKCGVQMCERSKFHLGVLTTSCLTVIGQMTGTNTRKISLGQKLQIFYLVLSNFFKEY